MTERGADRQTNTGATHGWMPVRALRGITLAALAGLLLGGCVYRINIQQGNLLDEEQIEQLEVGMTRKQVRFLLGTPMVDDPFHAERWDYVYYLALGRREPIMSHMLTVYFEGDLVSRIERHEDLEDETMEPRGLPEPDQSG
ncbi:outer membrane protein assembly factor BamE [Lentisalinibacter orientalis]|uniref:outer membrane protein assembly factor BamE n=1 Tax=Lentisalinibacter orientalis TaxID=2992241 RepID=UPI00386F2386